MRVAQGAPRQRPTAILTTSSSMRRPRLEAGTAFNQEADSLVAAARSLARVPGSVAAPQNWPVHMDHPTSSVWCSLELGEVADCALYSIHGQPLQSQGLRYCGVFVGQSD